MGTWHTREHTMHTPRTYIMHTRRTCRAHTTRTPLTNTRRARATQVRPATRLPGADVGGVGDARALLAVLLPNLLLSRLPAVLGLLRF